MTSPFYSRTLLFTPPSPSPSPPRTGSQCVSIFRNDCMFENDCISIFANQGGNADCQLASSNYFYLVIVFTAGQYNLSRTHVLENKYDAKRGGRQFSMFMSENICIRTLVDFFDKAVAEGASDHCGNEVGR